MEADVSIVLLVVDVGGRNGTKPTVVEEDFLKSRPRVGIWISLGILTLNGGTVE